MMYVDVSILADFMLSGRNVTGVQRVTLEAFIGLGRRLGVNEIRPLVYDKGGKRLLTNSHNAFIELLERSRERKGRKRPRPEDEISSWQTFAPRVDDTLLLSEGLCDRTRHALFTKAKLEFGLNVTHIIYDVVPIARPLLCEIGNVVAFRRVFPDAISIADQIITISDSSKSEMQRVAADLLKAKAAVKVWKLPHEFSAPKLAKPEMPERIQQKFVICSGTIEVRKNQHLLVKAWRKLAKKHGSRMPQLVLVGKLSKLRLENSWMRFYLQFRKFVPGKIVALHGATDFHLRALYDRCLFSIYVSNYEGWGLPIGESLWCGRPVLSGISTSLPEVGGNLVDYVDPNDQEALLAAIEKLCFDEVHREARVQQIAKAKLRSWDDAISDLAQLMQLT